MPHIGLDCEHYPFALRGWNHVAESALRKYQGGRLEFSDLAGKPWYRAGDTRLKYYNYMRVVT